MRFCNVMKLFSTGEGTESDVNIINGKTVKGVSACLVLSSLLSHRRKAVTYYDLLGVTSDATLEEIKNAFFNKSKKLHPDSDPSNPVLHSQFVQLNEAYRVLSKELSRKEYDFKIQPPYSGGQTFRPTSSYRASADADENIRYWEQFRQSPEMTAEEQQKKRKKNFYLLVYCVLAMMVSLGAHAVLYMKLVEVHRDFMDEKDRLITELYNEAKERARLNGFKKQMEILWQKHAEFNKKYKHGDVGEDK